MSVKDRRNGRVRIHCTAAKEGGACSNKRSIQLNEVESVVLDGLKAKLKSRSAIEAYLKVYNDERKALAGERAVDRLRERFGRGAVMTGRALRSGKQER